MYYLREKKIGLKVNEDLPGLQSSSDLDPGSDTYPSGQGVQFFAFFSALYVSSLHFTHSPELMYDPGLHLTGGAGKSKVRRLTKKYLVIDLHCLYFKPSLYIIEFQVV